ncbi:flagellar biosynthesis protein FlgL [Parerythrobacter lacustris]|uniref:Flagellar biosynthesis protein FlgL n=1 Tax=Parerythrobacter lacustris TaxID=2969984 RepID=A0ABT1XQN9_9SPHN|nr:flagellar biosynthesis protein FlgL [Parerythrobacter lacustris]MCR2832772.1 flagellar biosynthesis protein FlgL [Parerythrobacter lacustris]
MITTGNSTQAFYGRSQLFMGGLRAEAESLQRQVSTGERIARSSDDPVAASRLRALARHEALGSIDAGKARRVDEDLQLTTNALQSVADDLIRARELTLWASSETTGATEHAAIATELEQLRERIFATANALDSGGRPLFGGTSGTVAYQKDAAGTVTYAGTASPGEIDLGQGQSITRGFAGPDIFEFTSGGAPADVFGSLAALASALRGGAADPSQAAQDALARLDDALGSVTRAQTVSGARSAWLEVVQDRQIDQSLVRNQQMADAGGVDLTSAIARLQQVLTVLEASQASFARVASLSLFERI